MTTPDEVKEFDPFESASNAVVRDFELYGMVEISAWACALVTGQGKVPFDPTIHPKRYTAIDVFIQPLAEIEVRYPKSLECHWLAEFADWAKTTLPSIKAAGFENVREINGKYARVARVPNGKKYPGKDKDGNLTGQMKDETTFKFVEFFADEDECRAMYIANGGQPMANGANGSTPAPATSESENMLNFMKVIINKNVMKDMTLDEAKAVITAHQSYPVLSKFYTVDSPEVLKLINEIVTLPF